MSRLRDIPDSWWKTLLDGKLWRVDIEMFKFQVTASAFRFKVRGVARKLFPENDSKVSVRLSSPARYVYVQKVPGDASAYDVRKEYEEAYPMMSVPKIPLSKDMIGSFTTRLPVFDDVVERVLAMQDGPTLTPEQCRGHYVFFWVA